MRSPPDAPSTTFDNNSLEIGAQSFGGVAKVGFQETLEFGERLFIEDDVIKISNRAATHLECRGDRLAGETAIVFLTREALLLQGGPDLAVFQKAGRAIMVEGGYSQDSGHDSSGRSLGPDRFSAAKDFWWDNITNLTFEI